MYNGGPGNVLYDGVFLMIRVYNGFRNKFSSVAQAATLGNFFNLHKRKMAADRYRSFLILERFVVTSSVVHRLRVVAFVESSFNVSFWCQGQCHALKVKECQICVGPARLLIGDAMGFT